VNKWHLENAVLAEGLAVSVKCIRQLVRIAAQNVKYRSNLLKEDLSTAETVIQSIEDID